jgi:hypothetical protein
MLLFLNACAAWPDNHWVQAESPENTVRLPPSPPIKRRLTSSDLRKALIVCVAKYDSSQLAALDSSTDDGLKAMFVGNEKLEFNQCMSAKGWLSMPDFLLTP